MTLVIGTKNTANRAVKEEKYDFPVVTLQAKPEKTKGSYKIVFNKAAIEVLALTEEDSISVVMGLEHPVLVVVTGLDCEKYDLYKNLSFASKPVHDCICKNLSLDNAVDNEFKAELTQIPYGEGFIKGVNLLDINSGAPEVEAVESAEEVVVETAPIEEVSTEVAEEEAPVVEAPPTEEADF